MDDDLEDEVIYQTMLTHLKLVSKLMINWPSTSSSTSSLSSIVGRLWKPDAILFGLALIALLAAFSAEKWWSCRPIVDKMILSLRLHTFGRNGNVNNGGTANKSVQNGGFLVGDKSSGSTNWELRRSNVGVYAIQGRRQKMEDRFNVVDFDDSEHKEGSKVSLYGVFDGHGGDFAAEFVEKNLFKKLISRIESQRIKAEDWNFAELLSEEILSVDKQLLEVSKASKDLSGTTALVALVHGNKLIVANVGDSRGVICDGRGLTIPLSFDHKPQQLKEQKRIKQAGGFVTFNGVWRVAGILATSRALGDYPLKDRNLIIADPDVLTFNVDDLKPRFMILASDGLWDTFSNEEAVAFIKGRLKESDFGAKALTLQAHQRGSLDNITVVVVTFDRRSV